MKVPLAFSLAQNADIDGEDTNRAAIMKNACDLVPVINANGIWQNGSLQEALGCSKR
jgi:hypothetical protein